MYVGGDSCVREDLRFSFESLQKACHCVFNRFNYIYKTANFKAFYIHVHAGTLSLTEEFIYACNKVIFVMH